MKAPNAPKQQKHADPRYAPSRDESDVQHSVHWTGPSVINRGDSAESRVPDCSHTFVSWRKAGSIVCGSTTLLDMP